MRSLRIFIMCAFFMLSKCITLAATDKCLESISDFLIERHSGVKIYHVRVLDVRNDTIDIPNSRFQKQKNPFFSHAYPIFVAEPKMPDSAEKAEPLFIWNTGNVSFNPSSEWLIITRRILNVNDIRQVDSKTKNELPGIENFSFLYEQNFLRIDDPYSDNIIGLSGTQYNVFPSAFLGDFEKLSKILRQGPSRFYTAIDEIDTLFPTLATDEGKALAKILKQKSEAKIAQGISSWYRTPFALRCIKNANLFIADFNSSELLAVSLAHIINAPIKNKSKLLIDCFYGAKSNEGKVNALAALTAIGERETAEKLLKNEWERGYFKVMLNGETIEIPFEEKRILELLDEHKNKTMSLSESGIILDSAISGDMKKQALKSIGSTYDFCLEGGHLNPWHNGLCSFAYLLKGLPKEESIKLFKEFQNITDGENPDFISVNETRLYSIWALTYWNEFDSEAFRNYIGFMDEKVDTLEGCAGVSFFAREILPGNKRLDHCFETNLNKSFYNFLDMYLYDLKGN